MKPSDALGIFTLMLIAREIPAENVMALGSITFAMLLFCVGIGK